MQKVLFVIAIMMINKECESRVRRISEAKVVNIEDFPFFVQIKISYKNLRGVLVNHACGATLIHPKWILTAGHCFSDTIKEVERVIKLNGYLVYAGSNKVFNSKSYINKIIRIYRPPQYYYYYKIENKSEYASYDVAIAELQNLYSINSGVKCVALASSESNDAEICSSGNIVGFDSMNDTETYGEYIKSALISLTTLTDLTVPKKITNTETKFFSEISWLKGHQIRGGLGEPYLCNKNKTYVQYGVASYEITNAFEITRIVSFESITKHLNFIIKFVPNVKLYGNFSTKSIKPLNSGKSQTNKGVFMGAIMFLMIL